MITVQQMESRLSNLEGAYMQVADRLNSMDAHLDAMRSETSSNLSALRTEVSARLAALDQSLDIFRSDVDKRFMWLLGIAATAGAALLGVSMTTLVAVLRALAHH